MAVCEPMPIPVALDSPAPDREHTRQERNAHEMATALLTLDTIARGSLPTGSLERYEAYRCALIESDQDVQSVSLTLMLFTCDLFHQHSSTTLH